MKPENLIHLMAGTFILLSATLTLFVSPWGLALSVFVGTMLIISAAFGFCLPSILFVRFGWIDDEGNVSPLAARSQPSIEQITPRDAQGRIDRGEALLVDVREPDEWLEGVALDAHLLPLSDLRGGQHFWRAFRNENGDREICLYCNSGARATSAARKLSAQGHRVVCAGGFNEWKAAKLPVRVLA